MDRVGRSCFLAIVDVLVYIEKAQLTLRASGPGIARFPLLRP